MRIQSLELELSQENQGDSDELDLPRLKKALQERLGRFKELIYDDVPMARQTLRKILGNEPLRMSPVVREGRKTFSFEGRTRVGALLDPGYFGMASPKGV